LGTAPSYRTLPRACDLDAEFLLAWPAADMSFMDGDTGVNVVRGAALDALDAAERAARRKALLDQWEWTSSLVQAPAGRP
jgi:acetyl-CoA carboxylase carboxyltransferase component